MAKKRTSSKNPIDAIKLNNPHIEVYKALRDKIPLLMLPVRLETRFEEQNLHIRIYPDQIHMNEHQSLLTKDEVVYGREFWTRYYSVNREAARREAELWLVEQVPGRRAPWVAIQTKPEQKPDGTLVFEDQPTRSGIKQATASCLPTRFAAVGYCKNELRFVELGREIPDRLVVAPELESTVVWKEGKGVLPVDRDFAWIIDYDEAKRVGMGITVPLSDSVYKDIQSSGLTLFVVGIKEAQPIPGAHLFEDLLEAHLYTDGLEFVSQGTPTNNTDDAATGWTEGVDDIHAWFERVLTDQYKNYNRQSEAYRLTEVLGLKSNNALVRARHGASIPELSMKAMNTVLWPVTLERYLKDLLSAEGKKSILPEKAITRTYQLFSRWVRGGSPLPVIGIGAQPYGVLPVVRTQEGDPLNKKADSLEHILLFLKQRWQEAVTNVPRLDPVLGDGIGSEPKDDVVALLGSVPHPCRFGVRRLVFDSTYFTYWGEHEAEFDSDWLKSWKEWYRKELAKKGSITEQLDLLPIWNAKINEATNDNDRDKARSVFKTVRDRARKHLRRQVPLNEVASGYFSGICASKQWSWVTQSRRKKNEPKMIWAAYEPVSVREPGSDESMAVREWKRPLVQAKRPGSGESAAEYLRHLITRLSRPAAARNAPESLPLLYQLLDAEVKNPAMRGNTLFREALEHLVHLAETDVNELELRFRETLGLVSHRLDAWFTALASERLDAIRKPAGQTDPVKGIQLGAFGWVHDLKPDAAGGSESQGYIHAPSLNHAATAAVLRAGWNAHGDQQPGSLMAVHLSSERVRLGAWLLDGIRQGQSLGDLLGYRFERTLRDAGLARYIDDCRRAVLKSNGIERDPRGPVDGLDLNQLYQGDGIVLEDAKVTLHSSNKPQKEPFSTIWGALDQVVQTLDAVADISIANSVHYLLQGNTDGASAALDAIATGEVAPPLLRSIETPRPGGNVSHRVLVVLEQHGQFASGTPDALMQNLAELQPALENWLSLVLGNLDRIVCEVRFLSESAESTSDSIMVSMGQLGLSATNIVSEAPPGTVQTTSAWGNRVSAWARTYRPGFEGSVEIKFEPEVEPDHVTFKECAQLAFALRSLISRSRPLKAADLELPDAAHSENWNVEDLELRVNALRNTFEAAVSELESLLPQIDTKENPEFTVNEELLRSSMTWLANLGLPQALPLTGWTTNMLGALIEEARSVAQSGRKRLDRVAALEENWQVNEVSTHTTDDPSTNARIRYRQLQSVLETLINKTFPLLPDFTTIHPTQINHAFSKSNDLLSGHKTEAMLWLEKVAKVREDIASLSDVLTLSELIHDRTVLQPEVGQLPDQESWVATSAPHNRHTGYIHLWALDHANLTTISPGQALSGFVVDTWLEQIPDHEITTGVAAHFDAPSSRPPQSLLLLVPPEGKAWTFDLVMDSLIETLEAAQLRAVDPDILDAYGHHLPAIYPKKKLNTGT